VRMSKSFRLALQIVVLVCATVAGLVAVNAREPVTAATGAVLALSMIMALVFGPRRQNG
jgi:hypothetical protein